MKDSRLSESWYNKRKALIILKFFVVFLAPAGASGKHDKYYSEGR